MVPTSFEDRLGEVIRRTGDEVGPEVAGQLRALLDPEALSIMAGVVLLWLGSHAFGIGEAVDLIIGVVGWIAIGWSVFEGMDELVEFARQTYSATSDGDLDTAAGHLARAIGILGVQAVLAVLMRGRSPSGRGTRLPPGPPPPRTPGRFYRPATVGTAARAAGAGATTFWGDMIFSTLGTAEEQRLVYLHEKVHQFLAPKLYFMRDVRVTGRVDSYFKSSLYRWFEEFLAETFARFRTLGYDPKQFWLGLSFPVKFKYVHLIRGGGYNQYMAGKGVFTEAAALIATVQTAEMAVDVYLSGPPVPGTEGK